jgi:hypothetical protein
MNEQNEATLVIGKARHHEQVGPIIRRLEEKRIPHADISIISPGDLPGDDPADEKPRANADRAHDMTVGAVTGGIAMGALGCLVGLASLAIPGLGLFIVAGPIAAALGDAAVGGAIGAIAGTLIGLRVPEHRAKAYEESLRSGSAIISIHAATRRGAATARKALEDAGAVDVFEVADETQPA